MDKAKLLINHGDGKYETPQDVMVGGKALSGSNLGVSVADWDGDGTLDLIVGDGQGVVTFYKGKQTSDWRGGAVRTGASYEFAAGRPLIDAALFPNADDRPAGRAKASVADWNGDGKLDLLVGDFSSSREAPKNLTAAQKERLKVLQAEQGKNSEALGKAYQAAVAKVEKKLGYRLDKDTNEERTKAFSEAIRKEMATDKTFQELSKKSQKLAEELAPLAGEYKTDGFVRVYLRK
jgi:hypothetical protein